MLITRIDRYKKSISYRNAIMPNNLPIDQTRTLEYQLKSYFGFDLFKKGQKAVIQRIMDQQSALAIFPTGAGKSLCYQMPSVLLPKMTLVVSPLLSLMKDQLDFLRAKNIPAARLDCNCHRSGDYRPGRVLYPVNHQYSFRFIADRTGAGCGCAAGWNR